MYSFLQDRSKTVPDKVKVARYAWQNVNVYWPNKEQSLLDWMGATLDNRKRLKLQQADLTALWRCIHDVIQTDKCHQHTPTGQPMVLKPALYQLLLQELTSHARGNPQTCESHDVIISCCLRVLTSSMFGQVWSSRQDHLLVMMVSCLELVERQLGKEQLSSQLLQLMEAAAMKYHTLVRRATNHIQIMSSCTQKLFSPLLSVLQAVCHHRGRLQEQLSDSTQAVVRTFLYSLFPSDLSRDFETYFTLTTTEEELNQQKPKFIEAVFTKLTSLLSDGAGKQQGSLLILPQLYKAFLDAFLRTNRTIAFQCFQHLCQCLATIPALTTVSMETIPITQNQKLVALGSLMAIVLEHEVYDMAADHVDGDKQLSWLRRLSQWVNSLEVKERSQEWFDVQRHLLVMNYAIIEPCIVTFLQVAWFSVGEHTACTEIYYTPKERKLLQHLKLKGPAVQSQIQLLCEVIALYSRLRQLPKLVSKVTQALWQTELRRPVPWSIQLQKTFGECVTGQPQTVVLKIWETLLTEISSHIQQDDVPVHSVSLLCLLLSVTMTTARLADYSVTHQVSAQVSQLMTTTKEKVVTPLNVQIKQNHNCEHAAAVLQLDHSWEQLHLTLLQYSQLYRSAKSTESDDITDMNEEADADDIIKVCGVLEVDNLERNSPEIKYHKVKLLSQKLRECLARGLPVEPPGVDCMNQILDLLSEAERGAYASSPQGFESITEESLRAAIWCEVCQLFPLVVGSLTTQQKTLIATEFVQTFVNIGDLNEGSAICEATQNLITSGALWEQGAMAGHVLSAVWRAITDKLSESQTSPSKQKKKRKQKPEPDCGLRDLLARVVQTQPDDTNSMESMRQDLSTELLLSRGTMSLTPTRCQDLFRHLQILDELPLEFMSPSNQVYCYLATQALVASLPVTTDTCRLAEKCLGVLTVLYTQLRDRGAVVIDTQVTLDWLRLYMSQTHHDQVTKIIQDAALNLHTTIVKLSVFSEAELRGVHASVNKAVGEFSGGSTELQENLLTAKALVIIQQHLVKVRKKQYIQTEIVDEILNTLSCWLHSLVPCYFKDADWPKDLDTSLLLPDQQSAEAINIQQLSESFRDKMSKLRGDLQSRTSDVKSDKYTSEKTLVNKLPAADRICEGCVKNLESRREPMETSSLLDTETLLKAELLKSFSVELSFRLKETNHNRNAKEEVKHESLEELTKCLPAVCVKLLHNSQSADVLVCCLHFIESVCVYMRHVNPSRKPNILSDPKKQGLSDTNPSYGDPAMEIEESDETSDEDSDDHTEPNDATFHQCIQNEDSLNKFFSIAWQSLLSILHLTNHHLLDKKYKSCPLITYDRSQKNIPNDGCTLSEKSSRSQEKTDLELSPELKEHIKKTLSLLVVTAGTQQVALWIGQLLPDMATGCAEAGPEITWSALELCAVVFDCKLQGEKYNLQVQLAQQVSCLLPQLLSEMSCNWLPQYCPLVNAALTTQCRLILWSSGSLKLGEVVWMLEGALVVPLTTLSLGDFVDLYMALMSWLHQLIKTYTQVLLSNMHLTCGILRWLLAALVWFGQQSPEGRPEQEVDDIALCANTMDKFLGLLTSHKKAVAKYIIYIIADYVQEVKKVTLTPKVKKALLPGIYSCIGICDDHVIAQLGQVLAPGLKDIFRTLYDDYNKFHKYTGRV